MYVKGKSRNKWWSMIDCCCPKINYWHPWWRHWDRHSMFYPLLNFHRHSRSKSLEISAPLTLILTAPTSHFSLLLSLTVKPRHIRHARWEYRRQHWNLQLECQGWKDIFKVQLKFLSQYTIHDIAYLLFVITFYLFSWSFSESVS